MEKTMGKDHIATLSYKLLNRILRATEINLKPGRCDSVKEWQVMWTTFHKLKMWFKKWMVDLVELGFTKED